MEASPLAARRAEGLHAEARRLIEATRRCFGAEGAADRATLSAEARLALASEALAATTRLMRIVACLLLHEAGDGAIDNGGPRRLLDAAPMPDASVLAALPAEARRLVIAVADLHDRVRRLDFAATDPAPSPARALQRRLERAL